MATKEQVEKVIKMLDQAHPSEFFKRVDEIQAGIGAVLRLLYESNETVTAGKISDVLNISTARVAVLIKKMVSKGLITKERGVTDCRVTIVRLTEYGEATIREMQAGMYNQVEKIIDSIGEERILEFISIADEIKTLIEPPKFNF